MPFHRRSNANRGPGRSTRHPARRPTGWLRGTVVELDADDRRIVLRVEQASRAARSSRGREVAVDLSDATLRLPDADGDTRRTLRDVFPGNRVEVRVGPGGLDRSVVTGAHLIHLGPEMPVGGLSRLWRGL